MLHRSNSGLEFSFNKDYFGIVRRIKLLNFLGRYLIQSPVSYIKIFFLDRSHRSNKREAVRLESDRRMTMQAPKLLPWYARKAGVPLDRAEALWRKAVRNATEQTGWVGNSEYWGAAIEEFRCLLAAEQATLCAPLGAPILRSQIRVWRLPLLALEDMIHVVAANWRSNFAHPTVDSDRKAA
jgi:hypothetical protein